MKALRIYSNEGSAPETRRVAMSDAATHIAANDALAYEAGLLLEFDAADDVPDSLDGMILESNGTDEHGEYYRYISADMILEAVAKSFGVAEEKGENWSDHLPSYIRSEDRYSGDSWYIGTLSDDRTIWLVHEDREGVEKFEVNDAE